MRWNRGRSEPTALTELQRRYQVACDVEDYARQLEILNEITQTHPDVSWAWFDLGLRQKWLRDWEGSRSANLRALDLVPDPEEGPEAWNLGIAATALGDWATARRAWTAFGLALADGPRDEPIDGDFGLTPIRLNPDPRFAEPLFEIAGIRYATEVVWATRLCPARGRIENVHVPDSGHRHGDVVLHDGDPVGDRQLGDSTRPVFNEIALLERGPYATLTTVIQAPEPDGLGQLQSLFTEHDFALESWTQSVQMLCKACSEGPPGTAHNHPEGWNDSEGTLTLGIAAPAAAGRQLLDSWLEPRGFARGPILDGGPPR